MTFVYPQLSENDFLLFRLGGPGLGNLLFPWARAQVKAGQQGLRLIAPTWPQVKIGPLLRGEKDLRSYARLFRADPNEVNGAARLRLLVSMRRRPEHANPEPNSIIVVRGMEGLFAELAGHSRRVRKALLAISNFVPDARSVKLLSRSIAIHVRRGDFSRPNVGDLYRSKTNTQIPIEWYVEVLRALRAQVGGAPKAFIFSDGSDHELEPLLEEPSCERMNFGTSLADMHALSSCAVLIASASTFSMWAAYLGQTPSIWFPGQSKTGVTDDPSAQIEFDPLRGDNLARGPWTERLLDAD